MDIHPVMSSVQFKVCNYKLWVVFWKVHDAMTECRMGHFFIRVVRKYFLRTWVFFRDLMGTGRKQPAKNGGRHFGTEGRGCVNNPCWERTHLSQEWRGIRVAGPWRVRRDSVRVRSSGTPSQWSQTWILFKAQHEDFEIFMISLMNL